MGQPPKDLVEALKKFADVAAACNRCGFCTSYCPTYNATGNEALSPRGRNQAFRAILEGKIQDTRHIQHSIDTCLLCGECTSVCFSEVPTADLMLQARHLINSTDGIPAGLKRALSSVLPYPRRLSWLLKILFLGKRLGISALLRRTGVLRRFSPELAAADELIHRAPRKLLMDYRSVRRLRERALSQKDHAAVLELNKKASGEELKEKLAQQNKLQSQRQRVAYMPVCGSQYLRPSVGLATLELLKRMNVDTVIPDLLCCGLPAASYGVLDEVRRLAKENIARLERGRYEAIVVDDSSCTAHLKEYQKFFQDDPEWLGRAHAVSQKIREMSGFWQQRGLGDLLRKKAWAGGPVAYHDPCKAQYGQRVVAPPRELLECIPNLKIIPVGDADQCCGGGGTFSFVHPELSRGVLASKTKNILATGCKLVVTSSVSCLVQLSSGLRRAAPDAQVLHLHEFLVRALTRAR